METLEFALEGRQSVPEFEAILVGVVGSGNLEVLVEKGSDPTRCTYSIHTSAAGFGAIWAMASAHLDLGSPRTFMARPRLHSGSWRCRCSASARC
jgi:malonate decarboxylase acyl carrier protein